MTTKNRTVPVSQYLRRSHSAFVDATGGYMVLNGPVILMERKGLTGIDTLRKVKLNSRGEGELKA